MATTEKTDYLKFDALSIRDLIRQKLSEDSDYTDYAYQGSNLSVFIDIISNMYQVLMFNLNNAAAESMFSDTTIYENINRLVNFIGYNPRGYTTSSVEARITYLGGVNGILLPPYSTVTLNKKDSIGNPITFSTVDYFYLYTSPPVNTTPNKVSLYNGKWVLYPSTHTADGIAFEKIILTNLYTDSSLAKPDYVAYPYIHVFIKRKMPNGFYKTIPFMPNTTGTLTDATSTLFSSSDKIFNLRLNEYKQYELTFGDNIHGEALKRGDVVNIVYLKSNGPAGSILPNVFDSTTKFTVSIDGCAGRNPSDNGSITYTNEGLPLTIDNILYSLYTETPIIADSDAAISSITNPSASTTPSEEETVEDIKTNAPKWFKSMGRVITAQDFDSYIRSNFSDDIIDLKVMNNWVYMTSFYQWLYKIGIQYNNNNPYKYINNNLEAAYGRTYADAADSNNVYIWVKPSKVFNDSIVRRISDSLMDIKPITTEPIIIEAISHKFKICAFNNSYNISDWDPLGENYLEVELNRKSFVSVAFIKSNISNILTTYFTKENQTLGAKIKTGDIANSILSLPGVKKIRTVFVNSTDKTNIVAKDGISFAHYTDDIISGDDVEVTNSTVSLNEFMFPELEESDILNKIKVIVEGEYTSSQSEF